MKDNNYLGDDKCPDDNNWLKGKILSLYDREIAPYLIEHAQIALRTDVLDDILLDWCDALSEVWNRIPNLWQYEDEIISILGGYEEYWPKLMNEEEKEIYNQLPEQITIYRYTATPGEKPGLCWALSRRDAKILNKEHGECLPRVLTSCEISKNKVIAIKSSRFPCEVLADVSASSVKEIGGIFLKFLRKPRS